MSDIIPGIVNVEPIILEEKLCEEEEKEELELHDVEEAETEEKFC